MGSDNVDITRAWAYHEETKHSEWSIRANPHYLDWANQPLPFKIYPTLEPIPLPRDPAQSGISALSAIAAAGVVASVESVPTLADLAAILYFSAGITKKRAYPGGEIYFRAASCTGALYEIELYVVCGALPGLQPGVYHFAPGDFALRLLRSGDHRGVLAEATAGAPAIVHAPAIVVSTGTYWRNAWKYRARTYRHFGWDNGTILANMLAVAAAFRMPASIELGFVDSAVNRLLALDNQREVTLSLTALGHTTRALPSRPAPLTELALQTAPLSETEVDYPAMREMHAASSIDSAEEVASWRESAGALAAAKGLRRPPAEYPEFTDTIEQVILRRGSSRRFRRDAITLDQLSRILDVSTRGIWDGVPLNDIYLIVNAVEGLAPGAYVYHADAGRFECLKQGDFRSEARHLGLQQDPPGDAAADIFFMTELRGVLERMGNRGYRAVQLEAGLMGGRMYLAAYAQRLGATGLTFFDDDVTAFFSPHAAGKSAIFLVAIGKGARP